MANNPPQPPNANLADILRTLSALAPQNQPQSRSHTPEQPPHGLPLRGPSDYENPTSNSAQYGATQRPWQPANQPWQPPAQTPWQPPQQQTWQPPQQGLNQQPYQQGVSPHQQHYAQPPHPKPHQSPHPPNHQQAPMARQTQIDPRQQQMSDPHHLQKMKEKEMQRRSGVDPATIIDWPTGLRCVMKTVAMNEKVIGEIKKLIQVQNAHEKQWYAGRKALIMKSADRAAQRRQNQKKINDMLVAVGGTPTPADSSDMSTPEQDAENLKTELEIFDAKVYRAQHQMVVEMTGKLRALGVPFFGTKRDLVVLKKDSKESTPVEGDGKEKKQVEKGKIGEMELVELQRKMLAILQDLCEEK